NSSYSYMIVRTDSPPPKSQTTGRFIVYSVCDGQAKAEPLGYSPMPANLRQFAFDAMATMPGAPAPPSMDDCLRGNIGEQFVKTGSAAGGGGAGGGGDGSAAGSGQAAGATDANAANADAANADAANAGADVGTLDSGNAADVAKALNVKGIGGTNRALFVAGLAFLAVMLAPPLVSGFFGRRGCARAAKAPLSPGGRGAAVLAVVGVIAVSIAVGLGGSISGATDPGPPDTETPIATLPPPTTAAPATTTPAPPPTEPSPTIEPVPEPAQPPAPASESGGGAPAPPGSPPAAPPAPAP